MSLGSDARLLLEPLRGGSHTILLREREGAVALARTLLSSFSSAGLGCTVLDTGAFYASLLGESQRFKEGFLDKMKLYVPSSDFGLEDFFPRLLTGGRSAVIVDNLNALHHKVSLDDRASANRKLGFFLAASSFVAKAEDSIVIHTLYERRRREKRAEGRDVFDMTDTTIRATLGEKGVLLESVRGRLWPGGRFLAPIPSD